jgi:hypothetical protein
MTLDMIYSSIDRFTDPNYHSSPKCREYIHLESIQCPYCSIKFDNYDELIE